MPEHLQRIHFAPNIQQQLALKDVDGILVDDWGTVLYETTCGRGLYVPSRVAASINMLDLQPGEQFVIVKRWNGRRRTVWDVWRAGEAEKRRAKEESSDLERDLAASIQQANARKNPPAIPTHAPTPITPRPQRRERHHAANPDQLSLPWEESVRSQSIVLTDIFAETIKHSSEKHGNSVKPEDVRALVITTFISATQRGGNRGGFNAA